MYEVEFKLLSKKRNDSILERKKEKDKERKKEIKKRKRTLV